MTENNTWGNTPQPAPETPKKRHTGRWIVGGLAAVGAIALISSAAAGGGGGSKATPSHSHSAPAHHKSSSSDDSLYGGQHREDLNSVKLWEENYGSGIHNDFVTYSVTNHSSKKSDYVIDYQVTNGSGTRVADGTEYANNVLPGQTSTGKDLVDIQSAAGLHVNATSVQRSASV